jgi:hypothetical protein
MKNDTVMGERILYDSPYQIIAKVPCHWTFLRYFQWHNMAFQVARGLGMETYVLHCHWYENSTRFDETISELLTFLHLEAQGKTKPLSANAVPDENFFSDEERKAVKMAYLSMASKATRLHLDQYFLDM